jgi:hypothetical protein
MVLGMHTSTAVLEASALVELLVVALCGGYVVNSAMALEQRDWMGSKTVTRTSPAFLFLFYFLFWVSLFP